jgi:hypothetical protein
MLQGVAQDWPLGSVTTQALSVLHGTKATGQVGAAWMTMGGGGLAVNVA